MGKEVEICCEYTGNRKVEHAKRAVRIRAVIVHSNGSYVRGDSTMTLRKISTKRLVPD